MHELNTTLVVLHMSGGGGRPLTKLLPSARNLEVIIILRWHLRSGIHVRPKSGGLHPFAGESQENTKRYNDASLSQSAPKPSSCPVIYRSKFAFAGDFRRPLVFSLEIMMVVVVVV